MTDTSTQVLDHQQVIDRIDRIAWQIYENTGDDKNVMLAGIAERGYQLAKKLHTKLKSISSLNIELHQIKLNKENPIQDEPTVNPPAKQLKGASVIVVDDVLNSGSTLIYGVKYFLQFEVKEIKTVVLVDRNHKRYPVKADFKGLSLSTSMMEHVDVNIGKKPYSVSLS